MFAPLSPTQRIRLQTLLPDLLRGLRAALATILPFYFALSLDRPELNWLALGGWLGSLLETSGSRKDRAQLIFAFALLGGLSVAILQALLQGPGGSTLFLILLSFLFTLLRVWGSGVSSLGSLLLIAAAISQGDHAESPLQAGVYFTLGASWATLLSSVVWPVGPHLPLRRAIAHTYNELSSYALALQEAARQTLVQEQPAWNEIARVHQRKTRESIEQARQVALALRSRRSGESQAGTRLRILLGETEVQFFHLIAMGESLETHPQDSTQVLEVLEEFIQSCQKMQALLVSDAFFQIAPTTPAWVTALPEESALARFLRSGQTAKNASLLSSTLQEAPPAQLSLFQLWRKQTRHAVHLLLDNLSPRSSFFQHAIRVATAVALASLLAQWLSPQHIPWVVVPALGILQPYPGATAQRAIERVVGTVFGCFVALLLKLSLQDPAWLALALIPLSTAAVITKPRSYRLFTFFLTPIFIIFAETELNDFWVVAYRSFDTLLGGLVALLCASLVLPSWEQRRLRDALLHVTQSLTEYAQVAFAFAQDPSTSHAALRAARRQVGLTLSSAETSLERFLAEPLHSLSQAENAMQFITYGRRLSNALTNLDTVVTRRITAPHSAQLLHLTQASTESVLSHAAALLRGEKPAALPPRPRLAPAVENDFTSSLLRITRYIELIEQLVGREEFPQRGRAPLPSAHS